MGKEKGREHTLRRRKIYRNCLRVALVFSCMSLMGLWVLKTYEKIPGSIKLKLGKEETLDIRLPLSGEIVKLEDTQERMAAVAVNTGGNSNIPADSIYIDLSDSVTMKADTLSSYQMNLKLFGIIPFKQVDIEVIKDMTLKPVGLPVGIYLETDGLLVIGVGDFDTPSGANVSPSRFVLKTGDYILAVDGEAVTGKDEFIETIEQSGGNPVVLTIRRDEEEYDVELHPKQNQSGEYKLGIWVRDNAQGVGTMTFVDENGNFGALGHGINDVDTSMVMELDSGTLYQTKIIAIRKGEKGTPGEMTGMIEYEDDNILGVITANTSQGIFGTCNEEMMESIAEKSLPIGLKHEVETGAAQIICTVEGEPDYYDIEIKEIRLNHQDVNKGIVLEITDPDLLAITGGIIQGMSGSPIIQDGKIVGAVTHVLVNDPTRGYGIFIENMLEH